MEIRGPARILGDEVSTELMLPISALLLPLEEQAERLLGGAMAGEVSISGDDDILLAGTGFGVGSARPAAAVPTAHPHSSPFTIRVSISPRSTAAGGAIRTQTA